jgi:hypothetical protein
MVTACRPAPTEMLQCSNSSSHVRHGGCCKTYSLNRRDEPHSCWFSLRHWHSTSLFCVPLRCNFSPTLYPQSCWPWSVADPKSDLHYLVFIMKYIIFTSFPYPVRCLGVSPGVRIRQADDHGSKTWRHALNLTVSGHIWLWNTTNGSTWIKHPMKSRFYFFCDYYEHNCLLECDAVLDVSEKSAANILWPEEFFRNVAKCLPRATMPLPLASGVV